jgi:hypothetical protein
MPSLYSLSKDEEGSGALLVPEQDEVITELKAIYRATVVLIQTFFSLQ